MKHKLKKTYRDPVSYIPSIKRFSHQWSKTKIQGAITKEKVVSKTRSKTRIDSNQETLKEVDSNLELANNLIKYQSLTEASAQTNFDKIDALRSSHISTASNVQRSFREICNDRIRRQSPSVGEGIPIKTGKSFIQSTPTKESFWENERSPAR